eukprot:1159614-Pyramimonas_sp.AAC.2
MDGSPGDIEQEGLHPIQKDRGKVPAPPPRKDAGPMFELCRRLSLHWPFEGDSVVDEWRFLTDLVDAVVGYHAGVLGRDEALDVVTSFLKSSGRMVRRLLEEDRAAHLESMADQVQAAYEPGDSRGQWDLLRRLLAVGGRPGEYSSKHLPTRRSPEGGVLADPVEVANDAHAHFAQMKERRPFLLKVCWAVTIPRLLIALFVQPPSGAWTT